ncbi:MAG TPA: hypothetical protein VG322_10200 [Candidatus Acidoferrales bacterium]|nr:hypothetical protein [Candidatus Acidoferrales bacterium]
MQKRLLVLVAAVFLGLIVAYSQANAPRPSGSAQTALVHDRHDGLDVSADPYTDTERAKNKFGKANPVPAGILPVEVFLRNELDQPIRIDLSTVQLEVRPPEGEHQEVDALSTEEVAKAIVHPGGPPGPTTRRFPPIGIPSSGNDKKVTNMMQNLQPFALDADVVPPNAMIHGFLFFNVSHNLSVASYASLYIPDAMIAPSNKPLMFYEVSLKGAAGK